MSAKKHTILIAGASGVVGKAATEHFAATYEIAANETYNVVNGDMLVWHPADPPYDLQEYP